MSSPTGSRSCERSSGHHLEISMATKRRQVVATGWIQSVQKYYRGTSMCHKTAFLRSWFWDLVFPTLRTPLATLLYSSLTWDHGEHVLLRDELQVRLLQHGSKGSNSLHQSMHAFWHDKFTLTCNGIRPIIPPCRVQLDPETSTKVTKVTNVTKSICVCDISSIRVLKRIPIHTHRKYLSKWCCGESHQRGISAVLDDR